MPSRAHQEDQQCHPGTTKKTSSATQGSPRGPAVPSRDHQGDQQCHPGNKTQLLLQFPPAGLLPRFSTLALPLPSRGHQEDQQCHPGTTRGTSSAIGLFHERGNKVIKRNQWAVCSRKQQLRNKQPRLCTPPCKQEVGASDLGTSPRKGDQSDKTKSVGSV